MAEAFAAEIAKSLLGKLGSFAVQEFRLAWGLEDDLARLEERLKAINAVLSDAEKQQSKKESIRLWLHMLREVLYDAEDVLDEIECETLRRDVVKTTGSTSRKVRRFFSSYNKIAFRSTMGHKIKSIIDRLANISSLKSDFNLSEQPIDCGHVLHEETEMNRSFESFSGLIGRDEDKERIINLLAAPFKVGDARPLVLPIVGMGGLGKTSLAKSVCDAENVKSNFDLNMEVCVSDDFSLKQVVPKIIKSATGERCADLDEGKGLEELPKDVKYMISLRFLALVTKQKQLPEGGIGCLKFLQTLLILGCENLENLCEDMQGLKSLRKLVIAGCDSLISLPRSIKFLTTLEEFCIIDCGKLDLMTIEEDKEKKIQPLSLPLRIVAFTALPATPALPEQLLQGSAESLQTFIIRDCSNINEMPDCINNLIKLQNLDISDCPSLSKRCRRGIGEDWPKIKHIPKIKVQVELHKQEKKTRFTTLRILLAKIFYDS
uniref:NBS-LRR resistance gene-like protein ARGH30 n=1 Tax=Populus alba TaxID=43335 RepID=A0A4U5QWI6_POPAL|nr:NBS-LRR resistance gene-like protein ARGH30 [Populus alba]